MAIEEGKINKGGRNDLPKSPRPSEPPKGQNPNTPQLIKKIVTCECGKKIEVWLEFDVTDVMNAIATIGKMGKGTEDGILKKANQ